MSKVREAMEERNQLVIVFKTDSGDNFQINIPNPRTDLTEDEIKAIADKVVEGNFFSPQGGTIVAMHKAKIIATETNHYDLVI